MNRLNSTSEARGTRPLYRTFSVTLVALLVIMTAISSGFVGTINSASAQTTAPGTAAAAPADSLVFLSIDLDQQSAQNQKATELLNKIGAGSVEDLLGNMSMSTTGDDITSSIDTEALLGGEAGLSIFSLGEDASAAAADGEDQPSWGFDTDSAMSTEPNMAAIVSAPDADAAYAAVESSLEDDATANGATITDQIYEGVTIRVLPGDEATGTSTTAIAKVNDLVVIGTTAKDVQKVIDTEAGRTPSLADSDDYKAVLAELTGEWLVSGYVNGVAASAVATTDPSVSNAIGGIDASTLQSHAGFTIRAANSGFVFNGIAIPTADGTLPSAATNFNAELPGMIPGSTVALINGFDLGASGILDTIFLAALSSLTGSVGTSAATPSPAMTPQQIADEQYKQLEAILGFNVKTDFIDQMVGEWGIAVWGLNADAAASMDPTSVKFLLVSNTETPATVADAVSKLSLLIQAGLSGQGTVTTRVVGDDQLNVLTISDPSLPTSLVIEYGIVGGKFIISYNGAVDELNQGGESLADNANYKAAMAELPAETGGRIYVDLSALVPVAEQLTAATASSFEFADASEKCAAYSSQTEAQAAFDADNVTNWELDQDFDGQACEDYFAPATPSVEPTATSGQYDALTAFAGVTYQKDNNLGVSAILMIAE